MTFVLSARLDLDAEERHLFDKYRLYDRVVYNSQSFLEHLEAAEQYREQAAKQAKKPAQEQDLWETFSSSVAAFGHNIAGTLTLQLTLQGLIDGTHIESQDLEEILQIERCIQEATRFLADYLKVAVTFDGREQLDEH